MDLKDAQAVFHDWEAPHYEAKWSISFDDRCIGYVADRWRRALPQAPRVGDALEIGCGTGFFGLNLWQAGYVGSLTCVDISEAMVAECVANGQRLGVAVRGEVADAERLPFPDASFDAVVGHAVIHHLPDLDGALKEALRVLRPGGLLVIAGEPTRVGDRVAAWWKRTARIGVKLAAVVGGADRVLARGLDTVAGPASDAEAEADPKADSDPDAQVAALEADVDVHTFDPGALEALARDAGFASATVRTEELTANWFGWLTRTVEGMVRPEVLPARYPLAAYRTWQGLSRLDERLRAIAPREVFYNAVLTARAPDAGHGPR